MATDSIRPMADQLKNTTFRFNEIARESGKMLPPLYGYNKQRLVSLEEATAFLEDTIPNLIGYINSAKGRVVDATYDLSCDEAAAITLYTMEWEPYTDAFYYVLNTNLRLENRNVMKPWFPYLKLLFTALARLPKQADIVVYRAIRYQQEHEYDQYKQGAELLWWGFSSCSAERSISEQEQFLGSDGFRILFVINCIDGVDIKAYSTYQTENEILLLPATKVRVLQVDNVERNFRIVYLRQLPTPTGLLESVTLTDTSSKSRLLKRALSVFHHSKQRYNPKLHEELARYRPGTDVCLSRRYYEHDEFDNVVTSYIIDKRCPGIVLRESKITAQDVQILSSVLLVDGIALERLYLSNNQIGDDGVEHLSSALSLNGNSTLTHLCLASNRITDVGAMHIANMLETNRSLVNLMLGRNKIRDDGLQKLVEVLITKNKTLKVLSIERNKFNNSEPIFQLLEKNTSMTEINIIDCNFSSTDIAEIRKVAARVNKKVVYC
ncbi:unnamed protein product [Adineta ricciae]|uniref:NAD(P)(+)--arginine ADP-ribosyltransferase n=1 Tax=Adineta ricciae TaxID=249248 RepID=A0A814WMI4_ADIRI|nr:unnamed protein product [Adineta ricciae]